MLLCFSVCVNFERIVPQLPCYCILEFVALRDPEAGSWLIDCIYKVLTEYSNLEILKLLNKVGLLFKAFLITAKFFVI